MLAIESARIAAVLVLADGLAEDAALAVRSALPLTRSRPGDAPDLKLLLAECERRIPGADANSSWLQAAKLGADPMVIMDLHWLQRPIEARPMSCDYPAEFTAEVGRRLASVLGPLSSKLPAKAVLLAPIGNLLKTVVMPTLIYSFAHAPSVRALMKMLASSASAKLAPLRKCGILASHKPSLMR